MDGSQKGLGRIFFILSCFILRQAIKNGLEVREEYDECTRFICDSSFHWKGGLGVIAFFFPFVLCSGNGKWTGVQ